MLSKRKYFDHQILKSNNKTKTTLQLVKTSMNKWNRNNKIEAMSINGDLIKDPETIANSFNLFFSSLALNSSSDSAQKSIDVDFIRNSVLNQTQGNEERPHFTQFHQTSTNEINEIIKTFETKDSHGYDEISSGILKISTPYILSPLTYIFNKIHTLGIFPDRMKFTIVTPLHKKGSTKEMGNYRPISLLTASSKTLEKLIHKRLYLYLENSRLLSDDQFGFRKN